MAPRRPTRCCSSIRSAPTDGARSSSVPSSTSPASAPDENNWNAFKTDQGFIWSSHIPPGVSGDRLTAWQETVFRAGERHGILRVVEAVDGAYRYDRDGLITDWLAEHSELIEPV